MRNAADSRYPAINCRIADTSAALSGVVAVTDSVMALTAAGDSLHRATDDDNDDVGGGDASFDDSFLTLRSVGANKTNTKYHAVKQFDYISSIIQQRRPSTDVCSVTSVNYRHAETQQCNGGKCGPMHKESENTSI